MGRFNPAKNSFVAGELSPRLEGRDDLDQYYQGLRQALNGIVLPHGGFMRRSGTVFGGPVKDVSKRVQLMDFTFSSSVAYVIEAGDLYFRFWVNRGRLEVAGVPLEVVTPFLEAEVTVLDWAQDADVLYIVHENHYVQKLTRVSSTSFTLARVDFRDGKAPLQPENLTDSTVTVAGAGPYTLTWTGGVALTTEADVGRAVRITKGGTQAWFEIISVTSSLIAEADLKSGSVPAMPEADWALGLFSNTEGCRTVAFDEGRLIFGGFPKSNNADRFVTSVSDDFENFEVADPALSDAENADKSISRRTTSGQINDITWIRPTSQRLTIGTTGVEFAAVGDNDDLKTPTGTKVSVLTTRGGTFGAPAITIDSQLFYLQRNRNKMRNIQFNITDESFNAADISILAEHILQEGGGRPVYQQDPDGVIWQPRDDGQMIGWTVERQQRVIGAHRHILGGCCQVNGTVQNAIVESIVVIPNPEETQDQVWVVVRRTINGAEVRYVEFGEDQYRPRVTVRSSLLERIDAVAEGRFVDSHLVLDAPIEIVGATKTNPVQITVSGPAPLAGETIEIRDVVGMTELNRNVYKVASPSGSQFDLTDTDDNPVDGTGFTAYTSGGVLRVGFTQVAGLDYLEQEVVQLLVNGSVHPDRTVSGGIVSLEPNLIGFRAVVGLGFDTVFETQRFIGGGRIGTDQGQKGRIQRVVARLHNTVGGLWGAGPMPDVEDLEPTPDKEGDQILDQSPALLVADDRDVPLTDSWEGARTVYFRQDQPLPATVLALFPEATSHER